MLDKQLLWEIAGLTVQFTLSDFVLTLEFPPAHKKFFKDSLDPKAVSKIELCIQDEVITLLQTKGTPILRSDTWEFWISPIGDYEFFLPYDEIPLRVTVKPDFSEGTIRGDFSSIKTPVFPLKNIENRIFSAWLGSLGDIILHASGVIYDGKGYCFAGDPGAGKSTLAAALAADSGITVLGEDQVVLRYLENRFWIFGTPWHLNPEMCSPEGIPLSKMFFLDRSLEPGAHLISPLDGITRILQTAFTPFYQPKWIPGILARLELLSQQVPFYNLSYQLGSDPVALITNA